MELNIDRVVELIELGFMSLAGLSGGSVLDKMILRWTEGKMSQLKTGYCSKSRGKVGKNQDRQCHRKPGFQRHFRCKINRSVSLDRGSQGETIQRQNRPEI